MSSEALAIRSLLSVMKQKGTCVPFCFITESHGNMKFPHLRRYDNRVTYKFQNQIQNYEWLVSIGFFLFPNRQAALQRISTLQ